MASPAPDARSMTARVCAKLHSARQRTMFELLLSGPTEGRAASVTFATRLIAGGVFIAFGAGKFLNHRSEFASFQACPRPICSCGGLEPSSSSGE